MDLSLNRFADMLVNGKLLYSQMVTLSKEKKEAILSNKIDELDRVVRDEQNQLVRLQEWEKNRKRCAEEFAFKLGRSASDISIQNIIETAPDEQKQKLEGLHAELLKVVEEQVAINDVNRKLIETRLEYINMVVDTVRGDTDSSQMYSQSGAERDRQKPGGGSSIINIKA